MLWNHRINKKLQHASSFSSFMYFIYVWLCFDCSWKLMTQQGSVNSYLHINERLHMTLYCLYSVSTKSSSHLKNFLRDNQNRHMLPFTYCSVTESLHVCFSTPQHGNPLWPWSHQVTSPVLPMYQPTCWIVSIILAWRVPMSSTDFLRTKHFT